MEAPQRFATRCVHAGNPPEPATGAVSVPIYQTSTFAQSSPGKFKGEYDYARSANPTRTALQTNLASLEGATFKDLSKLDIVGVFPNYASAHAAWKAKAQATVDNAHMRYFIVHLHRLLDPAHG